MAVGGATHQSAAIHAAKEPVWCVELPATPVSSGRRVSLSLCSPSFSLGISFVPVAATCKPVSVLGGATVACSGRGGGGMVLAFEGSWRRCWRVEV